MAQPFNMMPAHLRDSTCNTLSLAGMTIEHAAWLRKGRNADRVLAYMQECMSADAREADRQEREAIRAQAIAEKDVVICVYKLKENTGITCPHCQHKHEVRNEEAMQDRNGYIRNRTCEACGQVFRYKWYNAVFTSP